MTSKELVLPAKTPAAIKREQLLYQRVIQAATACVERLGLEGTTVEDIAAESGISRATMYRKFRNKEGIFDAMVAQHAEPFATDAIRILTGAGPMATRIEQALIRGVMDTPEQRWMEDVFGSAYPLGSSLLNINYRERVRAVLHLILQSGEVRALELEPTLDWFMRELMALLVARPWDEHILLQRIRDFILPVLVADAART